MDHQQSDKYALKKVQETPVTEINGKSYQSLCHGKRV
jgi:hypothetical protein